MDNQLINIIVLGTAFMILFISSQTTTMISVEYYFICKQCTNLFFLLLAKCVGRSKERVSQWNWFSW
jgi:hypothetical protein